MLKNLSKIVSFSFQRSFPQKVSRIGISFSHQRYFATAESRDDRYAELQQIAKLLGTTYYKHNAEVDHSGDIRLIDTTNRLIGVYNLSEAKKVCDQMGMDIVMINPNIKPAICKAVDYREELYHKFVRDVISKDASYISKSKAKGHKKMIKLGAQMTISDLRNKVRAASELGKKSEVIKIQMPVSDATSAQGRNIMLTFADMTKDFLKTTTEIQVKDLDSEQESAVFSEIDNEHLDKLLVQEYRVLKFHLEKDKETKTQKVFTEDELREIIQRYLKKNVKASLRYQQIDSALRDDGDFQHSKDNEPQEIKVRKGETIYDVDLGKGDLVARGKEARLAGQTDFNEDLVDFSRSDEQQKILSELDETAQNFDQQKELQELAEEVRAKYGSAREDTMVMYTIRQAQDRVTNYKKFSKVLDLLNKPVRPRDF